MLNKNQSKKSNSWKYFLIVPALAAFMVYFQVKVVAQEREITESMLLQGGGTSCVIDKNTSDAQLKREAERLKKDHGVTLKFSKVKRNSQGEITSIKATYKDESGKKGTTQVSGTEPIQPFRFYKKSNGAVGFNNSRGAAVSVVGAGRNFAPEFSDDFVFSFGDGDIDIDIPEIPELGEGIRIAVPGAAAVPGCAVLPRGKSLVIKDHDGEKMVIVDGKVMTGEDAEKALADMGPIVINGEDVLKKGGVYTFSGNGSAFVIDSDKIAADAMEKAHAAMEKAAPKMEQAREKMEKRMAEMDAKREQLRGHREEEASQAREEMQRARAELDKARQEMKKELEEMKKAREEMKAELEKERAKSKK